MTALKSAMAMKLAEGLDPSQLPPSEQGQPVRGTGGGMADAISASIEGEPAALSEGEFVFPADVVSFIGDGSSEAGARELQALIDEIRSKTNKGA